MTKPRSAEVVTRQTYLWTKALERGEYLVLAIQQAADLALEHPEWDMNERRTWAAWEEQS